jgi:thioredoxin reductase (NADPH)
MAGKIPTFRNGKVIHTNDEKSTVDNIYAIGDALADKPELTPVAIQVQISSVRSVLHITQVLPPSQVRFCPASQAGRLLAKRLFGNGTELMMYDILCTTVYTPLEYGCCGLAEEDAIRLKGEENIEVYHQAFTPLEWTVPHLPENICFAKLICDKTDNVR